MLFGGKTGGNLATSAACYKSILVCGLPKTSSKSSININKIDLRLLALMSFCMGSSRIC